MGSIKIGEQQLHYIEAGTGTPLVLVHGGGFTIDVWEKVLHHLAKHFRVITFDRHSDDGNGRFSGKKNYEEQANGLLALLERLNALPAIAVGWGTGCFSALHAAEKAPHAFSQVLLYEPSTEPGKQFNLQLIRALLQMNLNRVSGDKEGAELSFRNLIFSLEGGNSEWEMLPSSYVREWHDETESLLREISVEIGEELKQSLLQPPNVPIGFIFGETSASAQHNLHVLQMFPNSRKAIVSRSGNLPHFLQPEDFVGALLSLTSQRN